MKASELKELTVKELEERIDTEKSNLVKQKLNHTVSPLDNPLKIRASRKNIARMMTVLGQKKQAETSND
jgi:large subunit ribosomal protein L29